MYGTLIHYVVLIFLSLFFYKQRSKIKLSFITIYLLTVSFRYLCYFFLMIKQFAYHDYYLLDTFFPLVIFWVIYFSYHTKLYKIQSLNKKIILFGVVALLLNLTTKYFNNYVRQNRVTEITRKNFKNSHQILDSLGISRSAKVIVLNATSSNLSLIGLKRKGYSMVNNGFHTTNFLNAIKNWEYDFIITQNYLLKETVFNQYSNLEKENNILFKNDNFTIYKKKVILHSLVIFTKKECL